MFEIIAFLCILRQSSKYGHIDFLCQYFTGKSRRNEDSEQTVSYEVLFEFLPCLPTAGTFIQILKAITLIKGFRLVKKRDEIWSIVRNHNKTDDFNCFFHILSERYGYISLTLDLSGALLGG